MQPTTKRTFASTAASVFQALAIDPLASSNKIKVSLRAKKVSGTVQDDPFDEWVRDNLRLAKVAEEVFHAGKLKSPDIVLIDRTGGLSLIGMEVKKLELARNGKDPRGLTMDYNSTVPCGQMTVRYQGKEKKIRTLYYFALLDAKSNVHTSVLCDGDFLNDDFALHEDSKVCNESTYGHGSYGEASIRHRNMYLFPNPLNSKLAAFSGRHTLVLRDTDSSSLTQFVATHSLPTADCVRVKTDGAQVNYKLIYAAPNVRPSQARYGDLFDDCKTRSQKVRSPYTVSID